MLKNKPFFEVSLSIVLLSILSGCAKPQENSPYNSTNISAPRYISPDLGYQLSRIQVGEHLLLESSPLGGNITVKIVHRYFSASGKQCLRLVSQHEATQDLIACRSGKEEWFWSRSFSQTSARQGA